MYSVMASLVRFLPRNSVIGHIIEEAGMESKDAKAKAAVEAMSQKGELGLAVFDWAGPTINRPASR
jgi:hypothetical protein